MKYQCHIVFTSILRLKSIRIEDNMDYIIVPLGGKVESIYRKNVEISESFHVIKEMVEGTSPMNLIFVSKDDSFSTDFLLKSIFKTVNQSKICPMVLLIPYLSPPLKNRYDGVVQSFIISSGLFLNFNHSLNKFSVIAYQIIYRYLNSECSTNIEIVQVGKPSVFKRRSGKNQLKNSSIIIPHKGSLKLLNRCLLHLEQTEVLPANVDICFDDNSWKKFDIEAFPNLKKITCIYVNRPLAIGPFIPRHTLINQSKFDFIELGT